MGTSIETQADAASAIPKLIENNPLTPLQMRIQELESELAKCRQTIESLRAQNERLLWKISRTLFSESDYANFEPSEYTIPAEEMLANAKKALKHS